MNNFLLLILLVLAVTGAVFAIEWLRERRSFLGAKPNGQLADEFPLPTRYRQGNEISSAPMPVPPISFFAPDGSVEWNQIWGEFCDLAIAGGPPHRSTPLQPATADAVSANIDAYERVLDELDRGLRLVTGWPIDRNLAPGWIGLTCPDEESAYWMLRAVAAENIAAGRASNLLLLPAGPDFRLKYEVKNVITTVAKTHHYWTEHMFEQRAPRRRIG